jgi:mRNA interferase MazF
MQRGEIWWATLPGPTGSGPGKRRPVLIVQSDAFNASRLQTVIAVVITSNVELAAAPGNILLRRRDTKLSKDSVANASQLITLDRSFLNDRVGELPKRLIGVLDEGLRLVLGV